MLLILLPSSFSVIHLLVALGASCSALTISQPRFLALKSPDPTPPLPGLGEPCDKVCSSTSHTECKNSTCVCQRSFPVDIKKQKACFKATLLGEDCTETKQCQYHDLNSICKQFSRQYTECTCIHQYIMREIEGLKPPKVCFPGPALNQKDIPTFLGFGLGLSVMSALLCLVLRLFAKARYSRPRGYANAAIPPPLTVSETYAAFALAATESARQSPSNLQPHGVRSATSSRRTSYSSLQHQRSGNLLRLSSASSLSHHRTGSEKTKLAGSRRPSVNSMRSYRSQTGLVLPDSRSDRDHYILYMIRGPAHSVTSETTASTTCDSSSSPRTPKSAEQILAVYHAVPASEHSLLDLGVVGPSHTSSSFRTMSSEDVFQEEEEEEMETEEEEEEEEDENEEEEEEKIEEGNEDEMEENKIKNSAQENKKSNNNHNRKGGGGNSN